MMPLIPLTKFRQLLCSISAYLLLMVCVNSLQAQQNSLAQLAFNFIDSAEALSQQNPMRSLAYADSAYGLGIRLHSDSIQSIALSHKGRTLVNTHDFKLADSALKVSLSIGRKLKNNRLMAEAQFGRLMLFHQTYNADSALHAFKVAKSLYQKLNDTSIIAYLYHNVSSSFEIKDKVDSAIHYLFLALSHFEKVKDVEAFSTAANSLAQNLVNIGDTLNARIYFLKAVKSSSRSETRIENKYNYAVFLKNQNQLDSSEFYYKEALAEAEENQFKGLVVTILYNMAVLENKRGNLSKAIDLALQTKLKAKEINLKPGEIYSQYLLLDIYTGAGMKAEAKEVYTAVGVVLPTFMRARDARVSLLELIAKYHKLQGNMDSAYHYLELNRILNDSLRKQENLDLIKRYQTELETERNLMENQLLKKTLEEKEQAETIKNYQLIGSAALAALLMIVALWFMSNQKKLQRLNAQISSQSAKLDTQLQELKSLSATKEKLISSLAHDFRNRIAVTSSVTQLMQDSLDYAKLSEENRELIQLLYDNAQASLQLIDELTTDAVLNQSLFADKEDIDLQSTLKRITKGFETVASKKSIQIIAHFEGGKLHLHQNSFVRIVENLMSNAIKFSPLETQIRIEQVKTQNQIRISIADQGPGFTEEDLQKVFVSQGRLSAQPTANESSTGLGLNIVHRLVKNLGGEIKLESEVAKGSTFHLTFNL